MSGVQRVAEQKCCSDYRMFMCWDCTVCTLCTDEYYMVDDELWYSATEELDTPTDIMLCIGCLESRIGGKLTADDFPDLPINRGVFPYSTRLKSRLTKSSDPATV
jgi:hypothetical protein